MLSLEYLSQQIMVALTPAQNSTKRRSTRVAGRRVFEGQRYRRERTAVHGAESDLGSELPGLQILFQICPPRELLADLWRSPINRKIVPRRQFPGSCAWLSSRELCGDFFPGGSGIRSAWERLGALPIRREDWRQPDVPRTPDTAGIRARDERAGSPGRGPAPTTPTVRMPPIRHRAKSGIAITNDAAKFHPEPSYGPCRVDGRHSQINGSADLAYKNSDGRCDTPKIWMSICRVRHLSLGAASERATETAEDLHGEKPANALKGKIPGGAILWLRKAAEIEPESPKYHALLARPCRQWRPLQGEAIEHS